MPPYETNIIFLLFLNENMNTERLNNKQNQTHKIQVGLGFKTCLKSISDFDIYQKWLLHTEE